MIDQDKLERTIKVISQEAWKVEVNTTVNAICEYIVKETFNRVFIPELNIVMANLENFNEQLEELRELVELAHLKLEPNKVKPHKLDPKTKTKAA